MTVADFAPVTPAPLAGVTATPINRVCVEPLAALVTMVSGVPVLTAANAAAEAGIVLGMVRTNEEFLKQAQYKEVLSKMPLIKVERIGDCAVRLALYMRPAPWLS